MSRWLLLAAVLQLAGEETFAQQLPRPRFRQLQSFSAAEAHQAVAVDAACFYAVSNRAIGKYDKTSGKLVSRWEAAADDPIKHLNSGVVIDGKLYCAHSNWPVVPLQNSVEIWDAGTLEHLGRREFSTHGAALTWVDRHQDRWWLVFANYGTAEVVAGTRLVQCDDEWSERSTWSFPAAVIDRFVPYSCSGGSWGPDGLLYVTGHDHAETYVLQIQKDRAPLELVDTLPLPIAGQGIAWDRSQPGVIYGIRRGAKEVVVCQAAQSGDASPIRILP